MKEDILQSALKEVQTFGDFQTHKAEIDAEDLSWILQILSTNLYSDPIGSLIREYSSNAWDANVEAGNRDKPIEVGIQTNKDGGTYWYVTDLGPGLSPERIDGVYRKFGKSTKRNSNEAIGMMGLGKFSGLSYTNEVFIITRVDGIEYQYLMHKSEGVPQIDLLVSKSTDLPNGTTIKINIKEWRDKREFTEKTKQQLAYFENVYFNIDNEANINTSYEIIKGKTFTISTLDSRELRLKIGPVSYPIDWNVVPHPIQHISKELNSMAINFEIGNLAITPNRESILYNKSTIDNINKRLDETLQEIKEIYETQVQEYEITEHYFQALTSAYINIGSLRFNITNLVNSNQNSGPIVFKKPMLKSLNIPTLNIKNITELMYGYRSTTVISNGRKLEKKYHSINYFIDQNPKTRYLFVDKNSLDPKHTKYLCETLKISSWTVIQKHKHVHLKGKGTDDVSYYKYLGLKNVPKDKWRETVNKFIKWQKDFVDKNLVKYDDYVPPKDWIKAQKAQIVNKDKQSLRKMQGKILVKLPERGYGYSNTNCTFKPTDWKINLLDSKRQFTIYGTEEDKDLLSKLWHLTKLQPQVRVIITAKANHKYLELLPNFMHIKKFMEGKTRYFKKYVSLYRLYKLYGQNDCIKLYQCIGLVQALNSEMYSVMLKIQEEMKLFKGILPYDIKYEESSTKKIFESMEATAAEHNLYDWELETLKTKLENYVTTYKFLNNVAYDPKRNYNDPDRVYTKEHIMFAVFVCKHMKVKINLNYYQNEPTAERPVEETEEAI